MTNRETILGRVREALKIAAPHSRAHIGGAPAPLPGSPRQWLPPVGETLEEQIDLFQKNAENLKAEFHLCDDVNAASELLKTLAAENSWKKIALRRGELTDATTRDLNLIKVQTEVGYALNDLENCDAGITECESLVAQTGSVLVSAISAGGRALSVLPPHHVVLARRSQMLPDLTAALQRVQAKYGDKFPSFLSFISGPSRTGDIERTLVLGAHGPKKLIIVLLP